MCDNPPAMFGGEQCVGSSFEKSDCIANTEQDYDDDFCFKEESVNNLRDLPARIKYFIRQSLLKQNTTYTIIQGQSLNINCDLKIKKQIDNYFGTLLPNGVDLEWFFNGDSLDTYSKK